MAKNDNLPAALSDETQGPKLPTEVAKLYKLVNWVGSTRQHFGKFGIIDLEKMTVGKAESLISKGFTKLKKK